MILLRKATSEEMLRAQRMPAKLLIFSNREPVRTLTVFENQRQIGKASFYSDERGNVLIVTEFSEDIDTELLHHAFAVAANDAIRSLHPSMLYSYSDDARMKTVFPRNLFYPKGTIYKRTVEPWRYRIPDSCFDREGFLINQGQMNGLPFGWFSTRDKGCGWIAAYNILKLNGREQTMEETARGLSRLDPSGELFGENYFKLFFYLRRRDLPVKAAIGRRAVRKAMAMSRNGILLYSQKRGSHYCSYRIRHDGSIYLFNAVYGKNRHRITIDEFLSTYAKGIKVMLLYVERS